MRVCFKGEFATGLEFVEVEDDEGHGMSPENFGAQWVASDIGWELVFSCDPVWEAKAREYLLLHFRGLRSLEQHTRYRELGIALDTVL